MFSKILIANRGEIAIRIIRACKEMGINTVAIYSEADKDSLHVSLADESICIGSARAKDSYLNMTAILSAAEVTHAEAIHPGYGLLSENPRFAKLCHDCKIAFIGPSYNVISQMGDKDQARNTMKKAGVPIIPGTNIIKSVGEGKRLAKKVGYPLLVKARSGGGGRGIRLITNEQEFESAFLNATAEAKAAFSDGALYIEKFIRPAKHIEVQVLADDYGNVVCLGERECSIQRKNQKLLEESPAPSLDEKLRRKMHASAIKAAKAANYVNAGTIEFLVDASGRYYFMEMNTRLQVEHTVTEMITDIDLVKWQIRIAGGIKLEFLQKDISFNGYSIECRINAEDKNYLPCSGKITGFHIPGGPGVRFDTFIYQGYELPPFYDSMIGKLIVKAGTREEAIRKMKAGLCELIIQGIPVNIDLLLDILSNEAFEKGDYYNDFMETQSR